MKVQYIIEKISLKGFKESSVNEFEKPEVIIGRGSGADILLRQSIVAFMHARLISKQDKLFIERIESGKGVISVNGHVVKRSLLVAGDTIIIGNTTLTVAFEDGVWQLIEVRKELTKEEEERWLSKALEKIDISSRLDPRKIKLITLVLFVPLILFFFVGPLMGAFEISWSSGPISSAHKFIETDCKTCHTQAFQYVSDRACTQCHKVGEHSAPLDEKTAQNLPFENRCRTCHNEHDSEGNLILSDPVLCTSCHGIIQDIHPRTTTPSIKGFDGTHPEFALLKNSITDQAKIKLNHQYHMTSIEMDDPEAEGGKRAMACRDCHVLDPSFREKGTMKEITFDEFCSGCHKLSVGSSAAMLNVPHEKSQLVRTFLRSPTEFLYEFIQNNPESLVSSPKPSSRRSRKKSKPAQKTQKEWVHKQFKKIDRIGGLTTLENKIFFSAKGGCIECHFLDVQPVAGVNQDFSLAAFSLWDHNIRIWDVVAQQDKRLLKGHDDVIHSVRFDVDGKRLLSASRDFTARIWSLEDSEAAPLVFRKHTGSVNDAAFLPLQEKIITGSDDGKAIIWDIANQKPVLTMEHNRPILKVEINSASTRVLTWADDATAILWDTVQGKNLATLKSSGAEVLVVHFSPDGKQVVGGRSNGTIITWSAEDGTEMTVLASGTEDPLSGHSKGVTHLEFSGNGSKMISLAEDFSAKIWNLEKGNVVSTLAVYEKEYIKAQLFLSATFNEDGSQVVTGSSDKRVRLWNTDTGKQMDEFKGHENQVPVTFFSKDSSKIISAAYNNVAIIWDVEEKQKKTLKHQEPDIEVLREKCAEKEDTREEVIEACVKKELQEKTLRLPEILPTQNPKRFSFKGVNHLKHEYLKCETCHESVAKSVSTLDVSLPPIQTCRTCHEKNQINLNDCVYCHNYHPEKQRGFNSGQMVLDKMTPFGYRFLKQQDSMHGRESLHGTP